MKVIKIEEKNTVQIHEALREVNGAARSHTFRIFWQIEDLVEEAEKQLTDLGLPKKFWKGAKATFWSGEKMPNSYKWERRATVVEIERRSTGWFLNSVKADGIYHQPPKPSYLLTSQQDEEIVKRIRSQYMVTVQGLVWRGGRCYEEEVVA